MGNWVTLQLTQVNQRYLNKMYFYVYARQQLAEAWPSALLNSLERWSAHGCGRHGHSWARMLFPILLAQYFRREFDVQYFSGCGWSLAVLLASWESGKPQSPRLRRQTSPYHHSGSSQCTSPKHPVSCIEPGLVIRFIYDIYMFQCHSPKSWKISNIHKTGRNSIINHHGVTN